MNTLQKIEKKGYKVSYNIVSRNGSQALGNVTIRRNGGIYADGREQVYKNITAAYNAVKNS